MKLIKEVCEPCSKTINIGQPILECEICCSAIHQKCYKSAGFCSVDEGWICKNCSLKIIPRYNPFKLLLNNDTDKFYNDEFAGEERMISKISHTLEKCQSYKTSDLNQAITKLQSPEEPHPNTSKSPNQGSTSFQFSVYFMNIDGNNSNFDSLLIELQRLKHKFSIIALAETNVDQPLHKLYQIPGYSSFYQSTVKNKVKGTGVALYVIDSLNAEVIENLGGCSPDIESLFVKITIPSSPLHFTCGVIYRPPSGNFQTFLSEFEHLNTLLPKSGVRLIGDFNVDLLKISGTAGSTNYSQFEESFIKAGLTPVISIATHKRANCRPTCIDNIFTNDPDSVLISGTIEDQTSDHLPIFEITNVQIETDAKHEKHVKFYEYSNQNLEKFVSKLDNDLRNLPDFNDFSSFTKIFNNALDSSCKLQRPKVTKRTLQNKPWITESIKAAVDKKHKLKDNWVKSIKKSKPGGDPNLNKVFTDYRRVLKAVINTAKNSYNCQKILEVRHDRKKTWQLINELRGKSSRLTKPSIVIDNKKITDRRAIANAFNNYFNSIASKLNETIVNTNLSQSKFLSFEEFLMPSNKNSIFLEDCSTEELLSIIKELDNSKSSDIPIHVIKKSAHIYK